MNPIPPDDGKKPSPLKYVKDSAGDSCVANNYDKFEKQMKENVPTPETVSTPPPLTPKDSLSVEVEGIKRDMDRENSMLILDDIADGYVRRLLEIVDELMKENANLDGLSNSSFKKMLEAHVENTRLRKALEKIRDDPSGHVHIIATAALADGECNHAYKLERKIFVQKPDMICVKCGHKFGAALADGKEGGE